MRFYDVKELALDLSASLTTRAYTLSLMEGYSICISWTGAPVGTFVLQACNNAFLAGASDAQGVPLEDPTAVWVDITGSDQAAGAAAGQKFINIDGVYYGAWRLKYTRSSGTGAASYYAHAHGASS